MMEPWDGPAAVAFTDGRQIGATLDRNGLRPARYLVTDDDLVVMASESGVLPIPEKKIVKKWRLQPGKMFLIDMEQGRIIDDQELKNSLANAKPYREWIEKIRIKLDEVPAPNEKCSAPAASLLDRQQAFGYTQEDVKIILEPMVQNGEEATGSMGTDSALPVLSAKNKTLYTYFKQLFAQVTNPPIDPIREELVMSLVSFIRRFVLKCRNRSCLLTTWKSCAISRSTRPTSSTPLSWIFAIRWPGARTGLRHVSPRWQRMPKMPCARVPTS
jgi:glutamate synthase (NADPH/NADH) large chain